MSTEPQEKEARTEPPETEERRGRGGGLIWFIGAAVFLALYLSRQDDALASAINLFRTAGLFVIILGILIFVHELGHFLAARWAGIRVFEFALGFGPRAVTYMQRQGTDFTVRWVPLGGFVNMKGMDPEEEPEPDSFSGKTIFQRAVVVLAGPVMNLILAVVLLTGLPLVYGSEKALVGAVDPGSRAEEIGLHAGDHVVSIDGHPIRGFYEMLALIQQSEGAPLLLEIQRGDETLTLTGATETAYFVTQARGAAADLGLKERDRIRAVNGETPPAAGEEFVALLTGEGPVTLSVEREVAEKIVRPDESFVERVVALLSGRPEVETRRVPVELTGTVAEGDLNLGTQQLLGFTPARGVGPRKDLGTSVRYGLEDTRNFFLTLGRLVQQRELHQNVAGPIGIVQIVDFVSREPVVTFIQLVSQLSLSLFLFNLLPIPILDGGHMLLLGMEAVRRRRLSPNTVRFAHLVGLAVIGTIFIYVIFNDISRLLP